VTWKTGLGVHQRHWKWRHSIERIFLLTFHSNHGPISYRFRDRWRFQSKIAKFSLHPLVFCAPGKGGSPWNWVSALGVRKLEWFGYRERSCRYLQLCGYNAPTWQTDRRTPGDSKDRAYAYRRAVIQEAQLMLTNLRDAFIGQSRSPDIVPFHMLGICSFLLCNSNFVFKTRRFYDIRPQKCRALKSGSEVTQGHWKWHHSIDCAMVSY